MSYLFFIVTFTVSLLCFLKEDVALACVYFVNLTFLLFLFPLNQPQHTPHLWQAAVAAAARQPQLLEGQSSSSQDQSASPVTFRLIPP